MRDAARHLLTTTLGLATLAGCADEPRPAAVETADRGWRAHGLVVAVGERAPTCAAAGPAMYGAFVALRPVFVAAIELDRDREALAAATAYLEAHADRYRDLETRMAALADRCAEDPGVSEVFRRLESP